MCGWQLETRVHDDLHEYCCTGAVRSAPQWEGGCRCIAAFVPNGDVVPKQVFHWYPGVGRPRHGRGSGGRARARLLSRIRGKQFLITLPKVRWSIHVTTHDVHHESPPTSTKCSQRHSSGCFPHSMGEHTQKPFHQASIHHTLQECRTFTPKKDCPMNIAAIPATSPASPDGNPSISEECYENRSQLKHQGHFLHFRL